MRLIRGLSEPFVGISPNVTFASHMFRQNVAWARFCFKRGRLDEISVRGRETRLEAGCLPRPEPERLLPVLG